MMGRTWQTGRRALLGIGVALAAAFGQTPALAAEPGADERSAVLGDGNGFRLGGYIRTWTSFNLGNPPETVENDRWDPSMVRGSVLLDADGKAGPAKFKVIGRLDREYKTSYLERLERLGANASEGPGNIMDLYNQGELREAYIDVKPTDRLSLRIGKQQVVWGESDFFRAMDVVHGFDFRWRSFFEVENEELRKPLNMFNAKLDVPEGNGAIQLLYRPGWDRDRDIGNTFDVSGGRWANQPNKGFDFLTVTPYDYRHPDADVSDPTWGLRWTGLAGPVNYSVAYLKTFNNDPVMNSVFVPFMKAPTGLLGNLIFPKVDLFGLTASAYTPAVDAVLSTELVYTKDAAFNVGSSFFGGALPGFGGIKKKDTLVTMLRMDKRVDLSNVLGAIRPSFLSVQLFDTWVQNFNPDDDIVYLVGYGKKRKEHTTILTGILGLNYNYNNINPTLAVGFDLSNGGGFFIPAVEFVLGDKWRLKVEADLVFDNGEKKAGEVEDRTSLFGYFANNSQLVFRLTRQF